MYRNPDQKDAKILKRQRMERAILRTFVREMLAQGFALTVDDGGDEPACRKVRTFREAWDALGNTDMDQVIATRGIKGSPDYRKFWFMFAYGNDGYDVLSDYTAYAGTADSWTPADEAAKYEGVIKQTLAMATRQEERAGR